MECLIDRMRRMRAQDGVIDETLILGSRCGVRSGVTWIINPGSYKSNYTGLDEFVSGISCFVRLESTFTMAHRRFISLYKCVATFLFDKWLFNRM